MPNTKSLSHSICDWCGVKEWFFRCIICDPRGTKHLCSSCTILWHSRGFGQDHLIDWKGSAAAGIKYLPFKILYLRYPHLFTEAHSDKHAEILIDSTPQVVNENSVTESAKVESDDREHEAVQESSQTTIGKENESMNLNEVTINEPSGSLSEEESSCVLAPQTLSITKSAAFNRWPTISELLQSNQSSAEREKDLNDRIFDACKVEDARFCNSFQTHEKHPMCQSLTMHYDHFQKKQLCAENNQCCFINQVYSHINQCTNARNCSFCAPGSSN